MKKLTQIIFALSTLVACRAQGMQNDYYQKSIMWALQGRVPMNYGGGLQNNCSQSIKTLKNAIADGVLPIDQVSSLVFDNPLHHAIGASFGANNIKIISFLLDGGWKATTENARGILPLTIALARFSSLKVIELLVAYGARFDQKDRYGSVPFCQLFSHPNAAQLIELAIKSECDTNVRDANGWSPLFWSVLSRNLELTELLLKHGAKPNIRSTFDETPLHLAVTNGQAGMVTLLLKYGADPLATDKCGRNVFDYTFSSILHKLLREGLNKGLDDTITHPDFEDVKPFASHDEMREAHRNIQERLAKPLTPGATATIVNDVLLFAQRFMRYKVACDIKKGKLYTKLVGLKLKGDGSLTMERIPLNWNSDPLNGAGNEQNFFNAKTEEIFRHNGLLFMLEIDPKNAAAAKQLKKLYEKRINPTPGASAKSFFPQVIIDSEQLKKVAAATAPTGLYHWQKKTIFIREDAIFAGAWYEVLAHEFAHHLQAIKGSEMGGRAITPSSKCLKLAKNIGQEVQEIFNEYCAEKMVSKCHPEPEEQITLFHLMLKPYFEKANPSENELKKMMLFKFPYFCALARYGAALHYESKKSKNYLESLDQLDRRILTCYEELLPAGLELIKAGNSNIEVNNTIPAISFCNNLILSRKALLASFAYKTDEIRKKLLLFYKKKKMLTPEREEKIKNAENYLGGDESFISIRERLGLA